MILSKEQKAKFASDGFLILKNAVPKNKVHDVFVEISTAQFPRQHSNYGPLRKDKRFDHKSELSENIREVFDRYINPLGAEILEIGNTYIDGQFSIMQGGRPASLGWHIDGTWIATDKNSLDGIPFFKLLVGLFLTDLASPNRGNLMVSPGGHRAVADFFKKEGPEICATPKYAFEKLYQESIPPLETIFVDPGDVILAHSLLPHTVSKNNGPDRPSLYFRLGAYENTGYPALSNLWMEWPGQLAL